VSNRRLTDDCAAIAEAVSIDRLMHDAREIARWVRLSGSDEERQAFEYVAGVLAELGLEPHLEWGDAFISLPVGARLCVGDRDVPAITHAMAVSTTPDGVTLPLVDAGAGDLDGLDMRGKAVVVDGLATGNVVIPAQEAGAAAVIFVNADEHVHEMIVSNVWGSPTPTTAGLLPRIPVVSIAFSEGARLRRELSPEMVVHLTTVVDTGWRPIPTLTAQLDGTVEPDRFVLFSGHIDSWHHGAMDNGTANAAMLETLRVLLPVRDRLRRSLRLAFWSGHSHGRYAGSTLYADTHWQELHERCVLHLNVDSLGGEGATNLNHAPVMPETRGLAAEVIEAITGESFTGGSFTRAGDQSFWGHGIPSLFMSLSEQPPEEVPSASAELLGGGLGWWWHTPDDTIERIDPDLLLRDARIYAVTAYRVLSDPVLPLDGRAAAAALVDALEAWNERAEGRVDLSPALDAARSLVGAMGTDWMMVDGGGDGTLVHANETIHRVVRALVPLRYVANGPFSHDPGAPQPPVPALAPIDELVRNLSHARANELITMVRRRQNWIVRQVQEAVGVLNGGRAR
jgi:hypothetical protein